MVDKVIGAAVNVHADPIGIELQGKRVLVVGMGISGIAAARFLCRQGALVSVSDNRTENFLAEALSQLKPLPLVALETGGHTLSLFAKQDMIVVSPGVPFFIEVLEKARAQGVPVIGEIELASRFVKVPLIGLTGTNGKTTTVTMLGKIFNAAGRKAFVGGNVGTPAVEMLQPDADWELGIMELSSFQLEGVMDFRPRVAIILNVTPDHQDRYADDDAYLAAKMNIMGNQRRKDFLLLNIDDEQLAIQYRTLEKRWLSGEEISRPLPFSCRTALDMGGNFLDHCISYRLPAEGGKVISGEMTVPSLKVVGEHNRSNILAAFMTGLIFGLDSEVMISALASFGGLAHRLEYVSRVAGIDYVNDSKATNLDAVVKAIVSFDQPIVLLLGGRDKGARFADLENILGGRVREIVPFGEAAELIACQLSHFCAGIKAANLQEAVAAGTRLAHPGDVVLLSPGCASFDEFPNYKRRGEAFVRLVRKLEGQA